MTTNAKRPVLPSKALMVGTVGGVTSGQIIVQAAQEFGLEIGPATASLASVLLTLLFSYFTRGGRAGEAE